MMIKLHSNQNSTIRFFIIMILLILSAFALLYGLQSLIEHKSPDDLASISALGFSFITYFNYHFLIILGALGISLSCWLRAGYKISVY